MPYLRRGMTLKGQAGIRFRHATAIVNHLYGGTSCVNHEDIDSGGTGIDSIFHQFLDDRSRTLYHLACGYLVGHTVRKKSDNVRHGADYGVEG